MIVSISDLTPMGLDELGLDGDEDPRALDVARNHGLSDHSADPEDMIPLVGPDDVPRGQDMMLSEGVIGEEDRATLAIVEHVSMRKLCEVVATKALAGVVTDAALSASDFAKAAKTFTEKLAQIGFRVLKKDVDEVAFVRRLSGGVEVLRLGNAEDLGLVLAFPDAGYKRSESVSDPKVALKQTGVALEFVDSGARHTVFRVKRWK